MQSCHSFSFVLFVYLLATQMWCLGRLLPLMIGEKIPADNDHWSNFLLLLNIMDYLFAPTLSADCSGHLKSLIDEHHQGFVELYPTCSVIPKMHYMIHYPECIDTYVNSVVTLLAEYKIVVANPMQKDAPCKISRKILINAR